MTRQVVAFFFDFASLIYWQIRAYIHRYLEPPPSYEAISALYILLTWVYEFAPSFPYLRVIGDWGTGKTRYLQVVGSICFRPIFASGAATPSPSSVSSTSTAALWCWTKPTSRSHRPGPIWSRSSTTATARVSRSCAPIRSMGAGVPVATRSSAPSSSPPVSASRMKPSNPAASPPRCPSLPAQISPRFPRCI